MCRYTCANRLPPSGSIPGVVSRPPFLTLPCGFLVHVVHVEHVRRNSVMLSDTEKRNFVRVKGRLESELGKELDHGEAVQLMAELTSEHIQSCNSQIPEDYHV